MSYKWSEITPINGGKYMGFPWGYNISVPTACLFLELCFCWANFGGKTSGREKGADGFT